MSETYDPGTASYFKKEILDKDDKPFKHPHRADE